MVKTGEDQHALEGMLFSELALMVVDKNCLPVITSEFLMMPQR